jgi:hypothetical protein
VFYTGAPAGRFSYVYNGDMNGDAQTGNDLMYVPRNRQDIVLRDITFSAAQGGGVYTADQQYAALDAYINQDKYLQNRRGEYAERNGAEFPWLHQVDLKLIQDLVPEIGETAIRCSWPRRVQRRQLIYSDWGILKQANARSTLRLLATRRRAARFHFPYLTNPGVATPASALPSGNQTPGSADRYLPRQRGRHQLALARPWWDALHLN